MFGGSPPGPVWALWLLWSLRRACGGAVPFGHVVLVTDWKENLNFTLANVETTSMVWTSERMPISCFGGALYYKATPDARISTKLTRVP